MVVTGALLFLLGTINTLTTGNPLEPTEIIVEKHINPAFAEKLTSYGLQSGLPPYISNFMQHGTNIFFKPQFMISPTYAALAQGMVIESKEDCKKWPMIPAIPFAAQPHIVMKEPIKIVESIVSSGEPPVVDKVVVIKPSMPLAGLSEHPIFISPEGTLDISVSSPVVFSDTPVLPPLPHIPTPVINTSANTIPDTIPVAPELPPIELPQAPIVLDEPLEVPMVEVIQPTAIEEIRPAPISETSELPPSLVFETVVPSLPPTPVLPLVPIPAAPELTPLEVPQVPVLNEPVEVPIIDVVEPVIEEIKPAHALELPQVPVIETEITAFPPTPILSMNPIPALPELPPHEVPQAQVVLDGPVEVPIIEALQPTVIEEIKPALHETLELPLSPVLDTVPSLPQMPIDINPVPQPAPYVEVYENYMPLHIPEAPKLPPYSPPLLPVPVILPESLRECDKTSALVETSITEIHPEPVKILETPTIADIIIPYPALEPTEVEVRPINIPAAPILPELNESKLPTLIQNIPEVIVSPQEPTVVEQGKPVEPTMIPSPPELLPNSMPDLPISVMVSEPAAPEVPLLIEPQPILIDEPVLQSIEISAPPVLPPMAPFVVPDAPTNPTTIHDSPVIIAETSPFEHEIISNEISLADVPVAIPQAPILSPAPEIPLPVAIETVSMSNGEAKPVAKPLIIPPAPELPPLSFQPQSISLEEPVMNPSAELTPVIIKEQDLPQLQFSNAPSYMTFAEPQKSSIFVSSHIAPAPVPILIPHELEVADKTVTPMLSQIESIISFPTTCVKNIVIERVLPNIVREGVEVVSPPPSPIYPVLSPFSSTIGIRLF